MIVLPEIAGDQFWGRSVSSRAGARALESPRERKYWFLRVRDL